MRGIIFSSDIIYLVLCLMKLMTRLGMKALPLTFPIKRRMGQKFKKGPAAKGWMGKFQHKALLMQPTDRMQMQPHSLKKNR